MGELKRRSMGGLSSQSETLPVHQGAAPVGIESAAYQTLLETEITHSVRAGNNILRHSSRAWVSITQDFALKSGARSSMEGGLRTHGTKRRIQENEILSRIPLAEGYPRIHTMSYYVYNTIHAGQPSPTCRDSPSPCFLTGRASYPQQSPFLQSAYIIIFAR